MKQRTLRMTEDGEQDRVANAERGRRRLGPGRLIVLAMLLVIGGYPIAGPFAAGHTWRECDWNSDGHTTLDEWFFGASVASRRLMVDGEACIEYFDVKAGNFVRLDCPANG